MGSCERRVDKVIDLESTFGRARWIPADGYVYIFSCYSIADMCFVEGVIVIAATNFPQTLDQCVH